MNDLISRAVAIDDLHTKDPSMIWDTADVEVWVDALPSAQPVTIIESDESIKLQNSNDTISRQAAIEALSKAMPSLTTPDGCGELDHDIYIAQETIVDDMRIINDLPSAQPERKTGKWIGDAETFYKEVNEKGGGVNENTPYFVDDIACSECLALFSVITNETEHFNYCPNCGAKMEGAES